MYRRWPSAKRVSKASELLHEPLWPVMTVNRPMGISRLKFFRLLCRTPRKRMTEAAMGVVIGPECSRGKGERQGSDEHADGVSSRPGHDGRRRCFGSCGRGIPYEHSAFSPLVERTRFGNLPVTCCGDKPSSKPSYCLAGPPLARKKSLISGRTSW